jgi:Flp pilus assembly pilin Flp
VKWGCYNNCEFEEFSLRRRNELLPTARVGWGLSEKTEYWRHLPGIKKTVTMSRGLRIMVQNMSRTAFLSQLWPDDRGQDIAEYAVILAVVIVLVVGTITALLLALRDT